ncbi:hypothetical protein RFI_05009 [Reticulomyxa filosa]|uniref:Uncharacterized protein n=1 Tax=Reticulomyxa filosa TaxID=46433 RepID=X6P1U3_RETFI|nr:hypothetical protein RFI_05009 [Reticulomyxa filosa]|eukprot:ETO32108.1 hypothetical protein RFI_05009 [Reticulomyxa filosa]
MNVHGTHNRERTKWKQSLDIFAFFVQKSTHVFMGLSCLDAVLSHTINRHDSNTNHVNTTSGSRQSDLAIKYWVLTLTCVCWIFLWIDGIAIAGALAITYALAQTLTFWNIGVFDPLNYNHEKTIQHVTAVMILSLWGSLAFLLLVCSIVVTTLSNTLERLQQKRRTYAQRLKQQVVETGNLKTSIFFYRNGRNDYCWQFKKIIIVMKKRMKYCGKNTTYFRCHATIIKSNNKQNKRESKKKIKLLMHKTRLALYIYYTKSSSTAKKTTLIS